MRISRFAGLGAVLLALAALAASPAAFGASVTPTVETDNVGCSTGLTEFKLTPEGVPKEQTYSDGTLSVTISNVTSSSFDWSSTTGVDAVLVKAQDTNVYSYSPESTSDTGLTTPGEKDISHVSFCYDTGDDNPPPDNCTGADSDGDGVVDACDNCPSVANPDQLDSNDNGLGDACEVTPPAECAGVDSDGDGVADACDNCPALANPDQADTNANGVGDACEQANHNQEPPPPPPPPPPPGDQPTQQDAAQQDAPPAQDSAAEEQAPEDAGAQAVLGERISSGSAKLLAASGCTGAPFTAGVRGAGIARVVFKLDGNRVATLFKPNSKGLFALRINPARYRVGVHRLVAVVTFRPATRTAPRTLRASFQRCAHRLIAPRFTG